VYSCSASEFVLTLAPVTLVALARRIGAPAIPLKVTLPDAEPYIGVLGRLADEVRAPGRPPYICSTIRETSSQAVTPAIQFRKVTNSLVPE